MTTAQNLRVALSAYVFYAALLSRVVHVTCPYRRLMGRRCPLCGTTTSVRFLTRGDWRRAVKSNPLGIAVVTAVALLWAQASVAGNH